MLIILITLATITVTRAADVVVVIPSNSYYHAHTPVLSVNNPYVASYGYQSTPNYENAGRYGDFVNIRDNVYQGHDLNVNRRVDTEYGFQHNNRQWPSGPTTEASQVYNRYHNGNEKNANVFDYVRQTTEKIIKSDGTNRNDEWSRPISDSRNINRQSDDVSKSNGGQNNTYSNNVSRNQKEHEQAADTVTRNKTNSDQILVNNKTDQSSITFYHDFANNTNEDNATKTNMFNINMNNKTTNINNKTRYDTKTTVDNEVTKSSEEKNVDSEGDRWVWSNSDVEETTTLIPLDDRAAFSGGNCPTGTVKINDSCVAPD